MYFNYVIHSVFIVRLILTKKTYHCPCDKSSNIIKKNSKYFMEKYRDSYTTLRLSRWH